MKKVVLTFGVLAGLLVAVMMLVSVSLKQLHNDFHLAEIIGYTSMIVSLSMVYFGIRSCRNNYLGGSISFGEGFKVGLFITLIASTIYVTTWMIYSQIKGPGLMNAYFQNSITEVKNSGKPREEITAEIEKIEAFREYYKNPLVQIGMTYMEILPIGLLITLICAAVLKQKKTNLVPAI